MIPRQVNLSKVLGKTSSGLLSGARGLGETQLSQEWVASQPDSLTYDLLDPTEFKRLLTEPAQLIREVESRLSRCKGSAVLSVLIDEVQRLASLPCSLQKIRRTAQVFCRQP